MKVFPVLSVVVLLFIAKIWQTIASLHKIEQRHVVSKDRI